MAEIFHKIYVIQPLWVAPLIGAVLIFVWGLLAKMSQARENAYKAVRICNFTGVAFAIFLIIYKTILDRTVGTYEVRLMPFHTVRLAFYNEEFIRVMIMNVLLFVPFGMTAPFALERLRHPVLITIIVGLLLSIMIEFSQYYFSLGVAETDDVIMNTLGAALGTLSWKMGGRKR